MPPQPNSPTDLDDDNDGVLDTTETTSYTYGERLPTTFTYNGIITESRTTTSITVGASPAGTATATTWTTGYSDQVLKLPVHLEYKTTIVGEGMMGFAPTTVTKESILAFK